MKRGSGVLLHVTSLPSPYGIGDFGPWAYKFADFLAQTKQSFWQILPLMPTDPVGGNSPYFNLSTFAGNKLLISPEILLNENLLTGEDIEPVPQFPENRVDYAAAASYKEKLLRKAFDNFRKGGVHRKDYDEFCAKNSGWLDDFSLFMALRAHFGGRIWSEWPREVRDREPGVLERFRSELRERIELEKFLQYVFFRQWFALKRYCNRMNIQIIGDLPIYVNYDSADVWTNPDIFKLDVEKRPTFVSGVPPDYFSKTGQLWGTPVYRWDVLKENGYDWWVQRMEHHMKLFDLVRIDHFRGLVAYWEVPAGEKTAINGRWVKGPSDDLLGTLLKHFGRLQVIAEDLGIITADVREVMDRFGIPGMRVLLFAFGQDFPKGPYLPHNYVRNCLAYTTTHDTNTARGWFEREATSEEKKRFFGYIGRETSAGEVHLEFIRLVMMSIADVTILQLQDILGLGEEARMNRPATTEGNWQWRFSPNQLTPQVARNLLEMTEIYGRV